MKVLFAQSAFLAALLPFLFFIMLAGCRPGQKPLHDEFDLQGHRGAMGLKPENTLPGFFKAVDLGVNTIEFDLAVSIDHELVISHEPWFRSNICLQPDGSPIPREQERSFRIYELDYQTISEFDCGSLQHPSYPDQQNLFAPKPLMIDAIIAVEDYVRSKGLAPVRYNIEIKSNPAWYETMIPPPSVFARLLYEELLQLERVLDDPLMTRVTVQSFDPQALHAIKETEPELPVALLTSADNTVDAHLEYFGLIPEIYSPNHGILTPDHILRARELGMLVIPWTVNRKEDMVRMVELGVDGLITDYPNRFNERYPGRNISR